MLVMKVAPLQSDINSILSLDSAKEYLRVLDDEEDNTITSCILSAISEAEGLTNRQFATATYELCLSNFPGENFKFPKNPIQEIISIEYMDLEGNYQVIDSSSYYLYKIYEVGHIAFETFPNVKVKNHKQAVKITFKSGFLDGTFPNDLRQWLKVRVNTLFEYREELVTGTIVAETKHVDKILDKYKIRSI